MCVHTYMVTTPLETGQFRQLELKSMFLPVLFFFFRGEVIAKADHTEQILYSDIGKLLWTVLTSWPACGNDFS